ncbi:MAG: hypothetical protein QM757_27875 [Paludibaculum sp.]
MIWVWTAVGMSTMTTCGLGAGGAGSLASGAAGACQEPKYFSTRAKASSGVTSPATAIQARPGA